MRYHKLPSPDFPTTERPTFCQVLEGRDLWFSYFYFGFCTLAGEWLQGKNTKISGDYDDPYKNNTKNNKNKTYNLVAERGLDSEICTKGILNVEGVTCLTFLLGLWWLRESCSGDRRKCASQKSF